LNRVNKTNNNGKQPSRSGLGRLLRYARFVKGSLAGGLALTVITVLLDLAGPYFVSRILNQEIIDGTGARDKHVFLVIIGFYVATVLASLVTRYGGTVLSNVASNRISRILQRQIFHHVQQMPMTYFDNVAAGAVVSRVTNDTKAVRIFFNTVLSQLLMAGVYAVSILVSLLVLDIRLFLIAALSFPALFFLFRDFQSKSLKHSRASRRGISQLNANLNENIQGIEIIQTFGRERTMYDRFSKINNRVFYNTLSHTHLHAYSGGNATEVINYLLLAIALLYFGYGNISHAYIVPLGSLYLFIDYMIRFFSQMNRAMNHLGNLERARGAADHIFELLEREPIDESGTVPDRVKGNVEFDHVTFSYKPEEIVLHDVSFDIPPGKTAAFVGQTGAGKSTLMNLLFSFYKPQKGQIRVDGVDLALLDKKALRRHMAIVTQEPFLFTGTIESNITLNRPDLSAEDARDAMREVGGSAFLARLPKGIKTPVRERGNEFSSGERQLISFARALAQDPTILILDEATSHIDTETEEIIQKGIRRLSEGRTTLMIAHRLSTIHHAHTIYVLDQGEIVEKGSYDELMEQQGLFEHMVKTQAHSANV
jgi:ATP-binding cassette subfamily B multidrug efflux pump